MEERVPEARSNPRLFGGLLFAFIITGVGAYYSKAPDHDSARKVSHVSSQIFEEFKAKNKDSSLSASSKNLPLADANPTFVGEISKPSKRSWKGKRRPGVKLVTFNPQDDEEELETQASSSIRTVRPKQIALRDLPISQALMERVEEDQKRLGAIAGGVFGGKSGPSSNRASRQAVTAKSSSAMVKKEGPYAHQLVEFHPGTSDNGNLIEEIPTDLEQKKNLFQTLDAKIAGAPDYSLETDVPQLNHLLSFGHNGEVFLEILGDPLEDQEGVDFVVFENPFLNTNAEGQIQIYAETARVAVSESLDPESFVEFPCDTTLPPFTGCAGVTPVSFRSDLPLTEVGGDHYDLADVNVERVKYIRIRDTGDNSSFAVGTEGFDLDAVALIHRD